MTASKLLRVRFMPLCTFSDLAFAQIIWLFGFFNYFLAVVMVTFCCDDCIFKSLFLKTIQYSPTAGTNIDVSENSIFLNVFVPKLWKKNDTPCREISKKIFKNVTLFFLRFTLIFRCTPTTDMETNETSIGLTVSAQKLWKYIGGDPWELSRGAL